MTRAQDLARFAVAADFRDLSTAAVAALKIRILDALGCAIGALDAAPVRAIRTLVDDLGGAPRCTLIGGGATAPDRAAFYNGAVVRYLDFNDSYLAPGETCHPSDNLAAILAGVEWADGTGRDLLTALAVAYQVQCRLCDEAPVRARGFDHTTQGAYSVAAGVARALGLDPERAANAIAIAGTPSNALRVTRTGRLSHWKGLAFPHAAMAATHAVLLAARGITGPLEVFEGNKGFIEAISGRFEIEWGDEDLERVLATDLKRYNAEIHSQSAIEGLLALRDEHHLRADRIALVELDVFDVAYHIIGGGEEGDKTVVVTKEEADHSLPYLAAVALLDGQVLPEQFSPERILADDVQALLRRVAVRPDPGLSARFPREHACRIRVRAGGALLSREQHDYEGFHTRPMRWETVAAKFHRLAARFAAPELRRRIVEAVERLDQIRAAELMRLLASVGRPPVHGGEEGTWPMETSGPSGS
jgi:2-methylcitrate dehydratase